MHKVNAGLTVLVRLKTDCVDAASALLVELDAHQERLPFARSATTHFATITVIPAQQYKDKVLPAMLLFATSFCGPTRVHVNELVRSMGDGIRDAVLAQPAADITAGPGEVPVITSIDVTAQARHD